MTKSSAHRPACGHSLSYAPVGRSRWTAVFCRRCRVPVFYAVSPVEAHIYVMDQEAA